MTSSADRAHALIAALGLMAHPEGGYYREVHRSSALVKPSDGRDERPALTTIYFLLLRGQVSRWHRVLSEEVWHFYEGAPLDLWVTPPSPGQIDHWRLGSKDSERQAVGVVPAGWWQAARSTGDYTLVGCTVAPGFEFRDFSLAHDHPDIAGALRMQGQAAAELL
jgi:predicted cupin superfamily sugar epimerase